MPQGPDKGPNSNMLMPQQMTARNDPSAPLPVEAPPKEVRLVAVSPAAARLPASCLLLEGVQPSPSPSTVLLPFIPDILCRSVFNPPPLPPSPAARAVQEVAKKPYQFLLVNVLREYLQRDLYVPTPFPFDRERVFDDFGEPALEGDGRGWRGEL